MATYLWSTLANGANINFDPLVDQIVFDAGILSYRELTNWDLQTGFSSFTDRSGKTVVFTGLGIDRITTTNITFENSTARYFVGDLTANTVDDQLANVVTGSASHDVLFGLGGADTLNGGDGDDLIFAAGGGNDFADGGNGFDWYMVGTGSIYGITANLATGKVYYYDNGEVDTIANIEAVRGSMVDDTLIGNNANNTLRGRGGNDLLVASGGVDWVTYEELNATSGVDVSLLDEYAYNDGYGTSDQLFNVENVRGGIFADYIEGDSLGNTLYGQAGDDTLVGGQGNDVLRGGAGDDTIYGDYESPSASINLTPIYFNTADYGDATTAVTVNLSILGAQNTIGAGVDTLIDIQRLWGSTFDDTLTGNEAGNHLFGGLGMDTLSGLGGSDSFDGREGNDTLLGGNGNDYLEGGIGDDVLNGGLDTDWAVYRNQLAAVTVNLATTVAQNTISAGLDTLSSIENLEGSAHNDTLTGNTLANTIQGGAGNDTINAGAGDDILVGGAGNDYMIGSTGVDTAQYYDATAGVTVNLALTVAQNTVGSGSDRLVLIENVHGSQYNDTFTGDANANTLLGYGGDDLLVGGAGNDTLDGGFNNGTSTPTGFIPASPENDTVSYASATGGVRVSLNLFGIQQDVGSGQGLDTINNIENITGSNFDDILSSNNDFRVNRIVGGNGNDQITAGGNNSGDIYDGGAGTDTLILGVNGFFGTASGVTLNLGLATPQAFSGGVFTATGFENAVGTYSNDTITGTAVNNVIEGGQGDDTLVGGAGVDTLSYAGFGIPVFTGVTVSLANTLAQFTQGAGTDTISEFENLIGSQLNDTLTGNAGTNVIDGGLGNDTIDGGAGSDTASYASASAGVTVSLAITVAQNTGVAGLDTLVGIERLLGSMHADTLAGNGAANPLTGGLGADNLTGGLGADRFTYLSLADSTILQFDAITDFSAAQLDKIDLFAVDANAALAGDQAFSFLGGAAFTNVAGQLRYDAAAGMLYGDVNGDSVADLQIQFTGVPSLLGTDFVL